MTKTTGYIFRLKQLKANIIVSMSQGKTLKRTPNDRAAALC